MADPTPAATGDYLASLLNDAGASALPPGYSIAIKSTNRPGATVAGTGGVSQHALGHAVDFQIVGPNGPIPNRGIDTTGLYGTVALAVRGALPPELVPSLAWGGNFTTGPAGGPRDLMHLDFGGDRGRFGSLAQMAQGGGAVPKQQQVNLQDAIFGPAPKTAAAAPPASQTPPAQATPVSETGDLQTHIFGPAPTPPVTPSTPSTPPQTTTPTPSPAPTESDNAPLTLGGEPASVPAPAAAPKWTPGASPFAPSGTPNPLLQPFGSGGEQGQGTVTLPLVNEILSGAAHSVRNMAATGANIGSYYDEKYPFLAGLDQLVGLTPERRAAFQNYLTGESEAYKKQYAGNFPARAGEVVGDLLAPVGPAGKGAGAVAEGLTKGLPLLEKVARPVAEWATAGGLQNMLTSVGNTPQEWWDSFKGGAIGSGLLGGIKGGAGILGNAGSQLQREAKDLGFNLSLGELWGGLAKKLESYSQYMPFSGTATKEAADKATISRILTRNMGLPESKQITLDTMNQARTNAGKLMDQVKQVTIDPNADQKFLTDLANIHSNATSGEVKPVTNLIDHIQNVMANNGGKLPGDELHNLIAHNSMLDWMIRTGDRAQKAYGQEIRAALQDAASRTADPALYPGATAATKRAVEDFNRGRYNWKTIKAVEPLVERTGSLEDATYTGVANRIQGTPANPNFDPKFNGPNDEMQKLARVLRGPLQDLKSSGTGRELAMARLMGLEGSGAVGLGYLNPGQLEHYLTYVVAPSLAYGQAGRLSRLGFSPAENMLLQREVGPWLGNQLAGPQQGGPNPAAPQQR